MLKGFTETYTIDGRADYDPSPFFDKVKEIVTNVFNSIPATKVMLSLRCVMEKYENEFKFEQIIILEIHTQNYEPFCGSSYIPNILKDKNAVINIKNVEDGQCFKWSVTRALYPVQKYPNRIDKQLIKNSKLEKHYLS